jgi:hypothetical protein
MATEVPLMETLIDEDITEYYNEFTVLKRFP